MGLWEILKGEQPGLIRTLLHFENKGQFGEYSTEFALTNHNLPGNFAVLKNIYVPSKGKTAEVDFLMIHEKGIFVFESKNYSGWIFGSEEQLNWTQSLGNGEKNRFYNPIRQNKTHIRSLAGYLDLPESAFISYIVFSERCTLKSVPANTEDTVITRRPDMLRHIREYIKTAPEVYSQEDIEKLVQKLKPLTEKTSEEKQEHIENIQNKCPFCGAELVERKGRYGAFYGCSAYPKCRYTRQIK